ncbi:phosphoribosylformylglycinamidine cyclo-ligase [Halobacillus halophilus]|uniref:Phosphoribosylformylglycinamidine cyclo-ligase n=1 Tax=Halobacillus halophilus (strain ATCC 35676 / DSM 2266 / JCM 20832 / KCTC 3685 / LMG 17431 / NBRC 102448 / NCIMB 2269) TaxID=866895 RepID=I0JIJ7_HALH3|nr:phosphoribosylformylglycinamidine cyclo-ligase [Halobacillus halophilus]ASF38148.1 phosphoribosylformylglycinamidine cyclo-ligase [Halobacillus halophilus]CCG43965.1 phosphoribosylformylglycinamidine cyclo-ligase [Halobacillus halophilus DSM 2266]
MSESYKQAGVDVEAGYESVERMKKHVQRTMREEVMGGLGAFAGLFDISEMKYEQPVLVTGTDGVGTKLKLAFEMNKHDTIGVDVVAMCVNDIAAQGADPLLFLDYIACGKNEPARIEQIVKGIADGCEQSGAALIGGETAEMPGMYELDEYDLAGFVVGMADKKQLVTGESIQAGDVLIGLSSSGVHSNGFSLVRKIIESSELQLDEVYPEFQRPLGEELLTPTRIYVPAIQRLKQAVTIKGIAHITGGGFYENIPRALPEGLGAQVDRTSWSAPSIFSFLQHHGNLSEEDMFGVFNMGIGMVTVVSKADKEAALAALQEAGETPVVIGQVTDEEGIHWL